MDFLDLVQKRDNEVFNGKYFKDRPKTPLDMAQLFKYDVVDPNDKSYAKVLDNLQADRGTHAIKTNTYCGFKVNGYVITHDGLLWQVASVTKTPSKNKQAYRYLTRAVGEEFLVRLLEVQNPWGLE